MGIAPTIMPMTTPATTDRNTRGENRCWAAINDASNMPSNTANTSPYCHSRAGRPRSLCWTWLDYPEPTNKNCQSYEFYFDVCAPELPSAKYMPFTRLYNSGLLFFAL